MKDASVRLNITLDADSAVSAAWPRASSCRRYRQPGRAMTRGTGRDSRRRARGCGPFHLDAQGAATAGRWFGPFL